MSGNVVTLSRSHPISLFRPRTLHPQSEAIRAVTSSQSEDLIQVSDQSQDRRMVFFTVQSFFPLSQEEKYTPL